MYRIIMSMLAGLLFLSNISAYELKGIVTDEKRNPISFTSVFVRSHPDIGTVTDENGEFTLQLEDRYGDEILAFSFVGYKTTMIDLSRLKNKRRPIRVELEEDVIYLDEALVLANPRKMNSRKQIKSLLERVREQMKKDFPPEERAYNIVSDYYVYNHDDVVAFEEAVGELREIPIKGIFGMDSLIFDIKTKKNHFDKKTVETFQSMSDSLLTREQKKMAQEAYSKNIVHEMFWGSHPVTLFDRLEDKPRMWEVAELDDGNFLLIYTQNKNMMGVIKYQMKVTYVLNSYTYSMSSVKQEITGEAHIPFGYKLNEMQLKMLNLFTQGGDVSKFRIKHGYGSIQKLSRYERIGERMRPTDKSVTSKANIQDRKGNGISLHNRSNIKVLDHLK